MNKTIGFIDYSLDNFHAEKFLELVRGPLASRGWSVDACWAMREEEGRDWARANGVPFLERFEDFGRCGALMILAPGNPELHLKLAEQAFAFGVPVFIDKPIAHDLETAERIYRLADRHGVPIMTASALRCAPALTTFAAMADPGAIRHIQTWGGSGSFGEYAIHAVEMAVSVMGPDAVRIMHTRRGNQTMIHLEFSGERTATIFFHPHTATRYQVMVSTGEATHHLDCTGPAMFEELGRWILNFFETREEPVPREESLLIRRILDLAGTEENTEQFSSLAPEALSVALEQTS